MKKFREFLEESSEQSKRNKTTKNMMDASKGARHNIDSPAKLTPDMTGHKTSQQMNKAIGRHLRREDVLDEGVDFDKDPTPHMVVPTQGRFGKNVYHVKNRHDWRNETIATHGDEKAAQDHVDALNKAHREKHDLKEEALDESLIHVDHGPYHRSHMKNARGQGNWIVAVGNSSVDFAKHKEGEHYIQHNGSLSDAVKKAKEVAKNHGKHSVAIQP